jgi:hypothetical protein
MTTEATFPLAPTPPLSETGDGSEDAAIEAGLVRVPLAESLDHVARGLSKLLEQFKGKPRIEKWLTIYLEQVQEVEHALWQLLVDRVLDVAVGAQLDGWGSIVGQPRGSMDDTDYRIFIKARILVNLSNGKPEELIAILRLILETSGVVDFTEQYPAGIRIIINMALPFDASVPFELMREAKPGGVRLSLEWTELDPEDSFTFADGDEPEASATQGFGDITDPDVGGGLAGIMVTT